MNIQPRSSSLGMIPEEFGIGKISLTEKKVIISDPSYGLGVWHQALIEDVKPGEYVVRARRFGPLESSIAELNVFHKDNVFSRNKEYSITDETIGVDSQIVGLFNAGIFKEVNTELLETGKKATKMISVAILNNSCFVRAKVGSYPLWICKENGQVVGFKILFI